MLLVIGAREKGLGVGFGVAKLWKGMKSQQHDRLEAAADSVAALMMPPPVMLPPLTLPQAQKLNLDMNLQYSYLCIGR